MNHDTAAGPMPNSLFALGGDGTAGSVVFCPDYGGNVLYARRLVALLAPELRCLGLRLTPALMEAPGGFDIEGVGLAFAADIRRANLRPPLHLLGFSFAGIIAFETARHLAGVAPKLWIVDSHIHRRFPHRYLLRGWRLESRHAARWLKHNLLRLLNGSNDPDVLHRYGHFRLNLGEHPDAYRAIIRMAYEAHTRYRPRPWNGSATVLRGLHDNNWPHIPDDLGWRHLLRAGVRTVALEGDHLGLMQDADTVRQIAKLILNRPHGLPTGEPT